MNKIRRMLLAVLTATLLVCFGLFVAACNGTETYTVTVATAEHGTVALAPEAKDGKYEKGTEITATVTPDTGYAVDTFTVGGENKLSALSGNAYKFKVEKDTEIKATFKSTEPAVATHTVTVVNKNTGGGISH